MPSIPLPIMLLPILIASLVLGSLRHNTVQYSLILQSEIMLPLSCIGDYTVNQYSETTLILHRALCLVNRDKQKSCH